MEQQQENTPDKLPASIQVNGSGFFSNWDARSKKILFVSVSALLLGGTTYFIVKSQLKKRRAEKLYKNVVVDGSYSSRVQQLVSAIDGAGTNEQLVFLTLSTLRSLADYRKLEKAYSNHPDGGSLGEDLTGDLSEEDLQVVRNIIGSRPNRTGQKPPYHLLENWVDRLTTAYKGSGTDEEGIYNVLHEIPDKRGLGLVNEKFKTKNGGLSIYTMLEDEMSGEDLDYAKNLIKIKQ